jgi:hypothetical protein
MIYIYREAQSDSARLLAEELEAVRVRRPQRAATFGPNDTVVCWGQAYNGAGKVIGGQPIRSKFSDAVKLKEKGVPTIEVSQQKPTGRPAGPDPLVAAFQAARESAAEFAAIRTPSRTQPFKDGISQLVRELQVALTAANAAAPAPVAAPGEWLPRTSDHVGGTDFDGPIQNPDFYAKKETFVKEFRVHSFKGVSIRAGIKKFTGQGEPAGVAAWVRSEKNGWTISYDGTSVKQKHRDLAHQAIEALGLDFGAVDIGERADGSVVVLEVNRAPGLEGGTVPAYARAITRWAEGQ